tara:strand:- start:93940 stop:94440 length:501 start_codon:yes stop_codon:yes gene_type:complete
VRNFIIVISLFSMVSCTGGYSFIGGDTGSAKTVSVDFFPNNSNLVQPELSQKFTEALKDIFVRQTNLELKSRNGDLHFEGAITGYNVQPINAQASDLGSVAQNRLTVNVNVIFTNKLDPEKDFERSFSRFADFDSSNNLSDVESELIDQITAELAENILNAAIGDW